MSQILSIITKAASDYTTEAEDNNYDFPYIDADMIEWVDRFVTQGWVTTPPSAGWVHGNQYLIENILPADDEHNQYEVRLTFKHLQSNQPEVEDPIAAYNRAMKVIG